MHWAINYYFFSPDVYAVTPRGRGQVVSLSLGIPVEVFLGQAIAQGQTVDITAPADAVAYGQPVILSKDRIIDVYYSELVATGQVVEIANLLSTIWIIDFDLNFTDVSELELVYTTAHDADLNYTEDTDLDLNIL